MVAGERIELSTMGYEPNMLPLHHPAIELGTTTVSHNYKCLSTVILNYLQRNQIIADKDVDAAVS